MIWNRAAETADREELEELQLRRLREVVDRCTERVRLYRNTLAPNTAERLSSLDDLGMLPFTSKDQLRDAYPFGMLAVPREELARVHASSGTKGKPTVVGYTRADIDVWAEVCARALASAGAQHRRRGPQRLRLRPVHRRPRPALRRRAARLHRRPGLGRQHRRARCC